MKTELDAFCVILERNFQLLTEDIFKKKKKVEENSKLNYFEEIFLTNRKITVKIDSFEMKIAVKLQ